jgi:hypothetical protein
MRLKILGVAKYWARQNVAAAALSAWHVSNLSGLDLAPRGFTLEKSLLNTSDGSGKMLM